MFKSKKLYAFLAAAVMTFSLGSSAKAASYTVSSGDTLYSIGTLFNTSSSTLIQNNNLTSTTIYPGQVLNVSCKTYTVQSGDTLYSIARDNGITLGTLRKANGIWTDYIYVGEKLNIPVYTSASTSTSSTSQGVIPYTASDVDLLARLITAEANGEPYSAMVAVGGVVVNRVQSGQFSNSISGVIYQRINGYYQFTPVLNGWINKPATAQAINAAYDALRGADPSNGALFYFDDSTTNQWLWSKPITARIDKLVFVE